jgi:hypothetical protein
LKRDQLASDKSVASFGEVYQRSKDNDDVTEEEVLAKEASENTTGPSGTQFELNAEQLKHDKLK